MKTTFRSALLLLTLVTLLWLVAAAHTAPDASTISVPMRSVHGIELVQASLDGKGPLWFMLDPGGADSYSSYALTYLQNQPPKSLCIAGGCVQPKFVPVDDFSAGKDVGGSIGAAILEKYAVRLDYARAILTLIPLELFRPPSHAEALPLTFDRYGMPVVPATLNGIAGLFQFDIRAPHSWLFRPFAARSGLEKGARLDKLQLGRQTLTDPPFKISSAASGKFADPVEAGLLGNNVLSNFVVTLDFPDRRIFISQIQSA